jgi:ribosome-associated heat shock protein Hsp15
LEYVLLSSHHSVRLDKWLWAARFYKTRRLAVDAIQKGKVKINGEKSKPARMIKPEDLLSISQGPHHIDLTVTGMADKRGPARVAQTLYQETLESKIRGQKLSLQLKTAAQQVIFDQKKPDQRNRGLSRKAKRGD